MDELLDDLQQIEKYAQRRGSVCTIGNLLDTLQPATRDALTARLDDPTVSAGTLARILERHGHKVTSTTIRRHRRRRTGEGCVCP